MVLGLAAELSESGVDVILDKWDLKEGHDAIAFMEQMVTDVEIKKVAIISDQSYAEKADGRAGGVGTETQIISQEVYESEVQEKFVAIVTEKDEDGKPYLPTYYKARIYIDLSEPDQYPENFERLLRWIFDKPLYMKPELGHRPAFLDEAEHVSLGTTVSFRRAIDAIKGDKPYAEGALDEYLAMFAKNLERFRLEVPEGEPDELVVKSIEEFLPYRNEVIQLVITISQYSPNNEFIRKLHRFFESLISYMDRPSGATTWHEWGADNFKFIVPELFLYTVAILTKHERFDQAAYLLGQRYYLPGNSEYGRDAMVNCYVFRTYLHSLHHRNKRLELRRLDLRSDLLMERCKGSGIESHDLMQADFIIFLRVGLEAEDDYRQWWPYTLLFADRHRGPFEVFARSISRQFFDQAKGLLAIDSPADLEELLMAYRERRRELPRWEGQSVNTLQLLGYEQLATLP